MVCRDMSFEGGCRNTGGYQRHTSYIPCRIWYIKVYPSISWYPSMKVEMLLWNLSVQSLFFFLVCGWCSTADLWSDIESEVFLHSCSSWFVAVVRCRSFKWDCTEVSASLTLHLPWLKKHNWRLLLPKMKWKPWPRMKLRKHCRKGKSVAASAIFLWMYWNFRHARWESMALLAKAATTSVACFRSKCRTCRKSGISWAQRNM